MKRLDGSRTTEALSCLADGTSMMSLQDHMSEGEKKVLRHPWIGRSRFPKLKVNDRRSATAEGHTSSADAHFVHFAMEHEEGTAHCRADGERHHCPPVMDRAGATFDLGGTTSAGETVSRGRPHEGLDQDDPCPVDCRSREGPHPNACEANPRSSHAVAEGFSDDPIQHGGAIRQVQGMDVPRGPHGLHPMGHQGDQAEPESARGLGAPGVAGDRKEGNIAGHGCEDGSWEGSRGAGSGPSASDNTREGNVQFIGGIMVEGLRRLRRLSKGDTGSQSGERAPGHGHGGRRPQEPRGPDHRPGVAVGCTEEEGTPGEEVRGEMPSWDPNEDYIQEGDEVMMTEFVEDSVRAGEIEYDSGANNIPDGVYGLDATGEEASYDTRANQREEIEYNAGANNNLDTSHGLDEMSRSESWMAPKVYFPSWLRSQWLWDNGRKRPWLIRSGMPGQYYNLPINGQRRQTGQISWSCLLARPTSRPLLQGNKRGSWNHEIFYMIMIFAVEEFKKKSLKTFGNTVLV